jgi:ubiquinol-cytochrome c reductase cytochrome c1 subunit|tara:strand:- start:562 stop:1338 length:777 start_codon:yes stop_codon:yes gene_type:complete
MKKIKSIIFTFILIFNSNLALSAEKIDLLKVDWSFNGLFGTFDRGSLQRGYQVYTEVCASCHSMKHLSYRNLAQEGGPEFSLEEAKAIAASFIVVDGPDEYGEMFERPGKLSDKFVNPYLNDNEAKSANGGAYPPDMSVLVKARGGGANYLYSVLNGYEEPPANIELDDGVYYNKYMYGNKIKMANPLDDGIVEYNDGTEATIDQMSKDVVTFLTWAAEPHLETRHRIGFKVIVYLIILSILVYFSMKRIWSRIEPKV